MEGESFSQYGEDKGVWEFFQRKRDGYFVEVGAHHPSFLSQSLLLERNGWRGVLIEPLPNFCDLLREQRPRSRVVQAACGSPARRGIRKFYVSKDKALSSLDKNLIHPQAVYDGDFEIEVRTLDDILAESGEAHIDFLSIDVEGNELDVLHGFSLGSKRPGLIIVEDVQRRFSLHWYLERNGYRLVRRTGCNSWYVSQERAKSLATPVQRLRMIARLHLGMPIRQLRFLRNKLRAGSPECESK